MKNDNANIKSKHKLGASGTVVLMMLATVVAKGLGLLRSVLMAKYYGAGMLSNAFSEASHIPLTFFDLLFATAISGCFIPVYNSFKRREDGGISEEADEFACSFFNLVLLGAGILAFLGIVFADVIVGTLGLDNETKALTVRLMRIMFPMIIFTGTAYTLTGVMQSRGEYLLPAMISALYNAAVIIYFLFFDGLLGENRIYGLAVAYLVGWFLQLLTLLIPLLKRGFRYRPVLNIKTPEMKKAIRLAPSILVGSWFIPAALLSAMFFTSFVSVDGAVTIYDYANTAFTMFAGTLTYSICNYAFPELSRLSASGDDTSFNRTVRTGVLSVFALVLPFMVFVMFLSPQIIAALYMRGEFTAVGACGSAGAFRILIAAMPAFAVMELGSRVFYSKNLGKVPMRAAIIGIIVDVAVSFLFVESGITELWGVNSVAFATVVGYYAAAAVIIAGAARRIKGLFNVDFGFQAAKLFLCTLLCTAAVWGTLRIISKFAGELNPYGSGMMYNLMICVITFIPAAAVYLISLKVFRVSFVGNKE